MLSPRAWVVANVSLGVVILFLGLHLLNVDLPSLGQARAYFDPAEPLCVVEWKGDLTPWEDLDRCCLEARKQVSCTREQTAFASDDLTHLCATGKSSIRYHLNEKAYFYCTQQVIW